MLSHCRRSTVAVLSVHIGTTDTNSLAVLCSFILTAERLQLSQLAISS